MFAEMRAIARAHIRGADYCFQNDPEIVPGDPIRVPDADVEGRLGNTNWCRCGNCVDMPTVDESLCCREIHNFQQFLDQERKCITHNQDMLRHCLDSHLLEFMIKFRGRTSARTFRIHYNREMRKAAYRAFTTWTHGFLGANLRIPIPSCVVHLVRSTFPDPQGQYMGFFWAEDYPAEHMALH
ncbi:hypothetical protein XELAEV_18024724mg [Xenopus laevis]|uniref:P2X purinoreceptor 7 intracellular domain-containing protein n=1 Tax=Xenopus laevis TaxID=8355 RepID=A0A974D0X2_XENLA|nr:hypothetical protein XELAEV_18024724mg [Xenopus laevis]